MDKVYRENFSSPSINRLQVGGTSMNDTETVSENRQCKSVDGQNVVPTVYNTVRRTMLLHSAQVLTTECLPHRAVLDTIALVHIQILLDLTLFQTVDGVSFSYSHSRIVSRELAIDRVHNSELACPDQTSIGCHYKEGTNGVQQCFQLIRISATQPQIIHVN